MNVYEKFKLINHLIFDIDGVFTDGGMLIEDGYGLLRSANTKDAHALRQAINHGIKVAVITKGKSRGMRERMKDLGVHDYFDHVVDKDIPFQAYLAKYQIEPEEVLYVGDDRADVVVLKQVGVAACPYDASHEVIEVSNYISSKLGGAGCVRDVIDRVLRMKGIWV